MKEAKNASVGEIALHYIRLCVYWFANTGTIQKVSTMEMKKEYPTVREDYVCDRFSRVFWSLIEEPDICPNCEHYDEDSGCCHYEG